MFYGIQKGAIVALKSGPEWFEKLTATYEARRALMFELADRLNCTYDLNAVGMFVWAKLPADSDPAEEFIDKVLKEKNIFIAPGTIFGSNGEGYIRFSLCVKEDKIREAISRI
jgi:aspartate/methionine/tyrosine aminotransferase